MDSKVNSFWTLAWAVIWKTGETMDERRVREEK